MASRRPAGRAGAASSASRSASSPRLRTRYTPASAQAASTTAEAVTIDPVCDAATRAAAALDPADSSTTGLPSSRAAATNRRPSVNCSQ